MARFGDFDQYLDNAGDPLAEGKLYFYESGTTTPKTTYSDVNNSIPNTNPVLLSAAGRQPNIFFDGVAKVILTDNDDVQLIVRDPVGETATDFGDQWVSTKIYNATDVVLGSDGTYYRSLINGNQNNNPVTTTGNWTLLYSVEWNAGITYQVGAVVTYGGEQYQSLQGSNLNQNPSTASSYWVLLSFAWLATATYAEDQNAVGTDGILYTSLQNGNIGNDPATSPAYWVGTSAAAAASAVAAAASAAAALVSENAAAADAIATAADVVQTGLDAAATAADAIATAADRVQTGLDAAATAADVILTNADAVATAADRVQTGLDAAATSADAIATAADRVQTGLDVIATNADASSTVADAIATAADVVQTGLDVVATSADVVQTGLDVTAAAGSASAAAAAASYDAFDDRYLGDKASDPTLDNDGNALLTGALYFNTTSDVMKVYDGSAWNIAAISSASPTFTGTVTADGLSLGDNDKATFGAGNDLEIYSDGANAFIDHTNTGAGALFLKGDNNVIITNQAATENKAVFTSNGAVSLYYNNAVKFATTNTGIDVTGTATMDGLNVLAGNGVIGTAQINRNVAGFGGISSIALSLANDGTSAGTGVSLRFSPADVQTAARGSLVSSTLEGSNGSNLELWTVVNGQSPHKSMEIDGNGDISFYEDTGTTPKFFWDASAESLGIGTTSFTTTDGSNIELSAATNSRVILGCTGTGGRKWGMGTGTSGTLNFYDYTASAARLLIDTSGNVGIGTSSPIESLTVGATPTTAGFSIGHATTQTFLRYNNYFSGTSQVSDATKGSASISLGRSSDGVITLNTAAAGAGTPTEAMRITSSGNVGIGTTNPVGLLDIGGDSSAKPLTVRGGTGDLASIDLIGGTDGQDNSSIRSKYSLHLDCNSTNAIAGRIIAFGNGTAELMRIDSSGRVGIGAVPSPWLSQSSTLQLGGRVSVGAIGSNDDLHLTNNAYYNGSDWKAQETGTANNYYMSAGIHAWRYAASTTQGATVSWSEAMRIDSNGYVGIGTSSPQSTLEVAGGVRSKLFLSGLAVVSTPSGTATTVLDLEQVDFRNRRLSVTAYDSGTHVMGFADVFVNFNGAVYLTAFTQVYTGTNTSAFSISANELKFTQSFGSTRSITVIWTIH